VQFLIETGKKTLDNAVAECVECPPLFMKNSPLATVLLALLACAALGSLILCWMYIRTNRELRFLKANVGMVQVKQRGMQQLTYDLVEYSHRNPQIDPLLEKYQIKPKGTNSAAGTNGNAKTGGK
jgi:hypothetical protein